MMRARRGLLQANLHAGVFAYLFLHKTFREGVKEVQTEAADFFGYFLGLVPNCPIPDSVEVFMATKREAQRCHRVPIIQCCCTCSLYETCFTEQCEMIAKRILRRLDPGQIWCRLPFVMFDRE